MTHKRQKLISFMFSIFLLQSCKSKQEDLFNTFKNDFNNSIQKSNAKKFEYQYDGLSPQNSYFTDCKLKYLTLKSSGELADIEELIIFEKDSISKIIKHIEIYEGNDNGNKAGRNWSKIETDSIYVIDFKKGKEDFYTNNKIVKTLNTRKIEKEYKFIYNIKDNTEKNYNCR